MEGQKAPKESFQRTTFSLSEILRLNLPQSGIATLRTLFALAIFTFAYSSVQAKNNNVHNSKGETNTTLVTNTNLELQEDSITFQKILGRLKNILRNAGDLIPNDTISLQNFELAKNLYISLEKASRKGDVYAIYYEFFRKVQVECTREISMEITKYMLNHNIGLKPMYNLENDTSEITLGLYNLSDNSITSFNHYDEVSFKLYNGDLYIKARSKRETSKGSTIEDTEKPRYVYFKISRGQISSIQPVTKAEEIIEAGFILDDK